MRTANSSRESEARLPSAPTPFPDVVSESSTGSNTASLPRTTFSPEGTNPTSRVSSSTTPIDIDVLYRAKEAGSANFSRALLLLTQASNTLQRAKRAIDEGRSLESDTELLQFQAQLPQLFECRALGDGFANIINTIQIGIANLKGEPLNAVQINTVWRAIRQLSVGPFITFESSLNFVEELEEVGITVKSEFISEWLSNTSTYGANG